MYTGERIQQPCWPKDVVPCNPRYLATVLGRREGMHKFGRVAEANESVGEVDLDLAGSMP